MEEDNTIENLKKLKKLFDDGILTEQEFTEQKRDLLHLPDEESMPEHSESVTDHKKVDEMPDMQQVENEDEQEPVQDKENQKASPKPVSQSSVTLDNASDYQKPLQKNVTNVEKEKSQDESASATQTDEFQAEKLKIKAQLEAEAEFKAEQRQQQKKEDQEKRREYTARAASGVSKAGQVILKVTGWVIAVLFIIFGLGVLFTPKETLCGIISLIFALFMCPPINERIKSQYFKGNQTINVVVGVALFILVMVSVPGVN